MERKHIVILRFYCSDGSTKVGYRGNHKDIDALLDFQSLIRQTLATFRNTYSEDVEVFEIDEYTVQIISSLGKFTFVVDADSAPFRYLDYIRTSNDSKYRSWFVHSIIIDQFIFDNVSDANNYLEHLINNNTKDMDSKFVYDRFTSFHDLYEKLLFESIKPEK